MFPRIEAHVQAASGQARSPRARARDPRALGARADVRAAAGAEPAAARRFSFVDGPVTANKKLARAHGLGADAQGRLPALQGHARLRPALPERVRLPGPLDRGRRRALSSASTRSARSRSSASRSSRAAAARSSSSRPRDITRGSIRLGQWMDWGNDYFTFSDTNIEYVWRFLKRVHEHGWLYMGHRSTEWCPRCGTSLSAARALAVRRLPGSRRSLALRPLPAARPSARVTRDLDDDAVDAAGERRRGGQARRRVRAPRERRVGRRRALPGRGVRRAEARRGARRLALPGPVRRARARAAGRAPRDPVGRGHARPGHGHRPHRARLRRRGLRALEGARPRRADARRRGRTLLRRLRLAARALDGRGGGPDRSAISASAACWSSRASTSTPIRTAGAATRR